MIIPKLKAMLLKTAKFVSIQINNFIHLITNNILQSLLYFKIWFFCQNVFVIILLPHDGWYIISAYAYLIGYFISLILFETIHDEFISTRLRPKSFLHNLEIQLDFQGQPTIVSSKISPIPVGQEKFFGFKNQNLSIHTNVTILHTKN